MGRARGGRQLQPTFIQPNYDNGNKIDNDLNWQSDESPLTSMLRSFIKGVTKNEFDERLNVEIGLKALRLTDQVKIVYRTKQISWLVDILILQLSDKGIVSINENLFYTLSEIFQSVKALSAEELNNKIERILIKLNNPSEREWLAVLKNSKINTAFLMLEEI